MVFVSLRENWRNFKVFEGILSKNQAKKVIFSIFKVEALVLSPLFLWRVIVEDFLKFFAGYMRLVFWWMRVCLFWFRNPFYKDLILEYHLIIWWFPWGNNFTTEIVAATAWPQVCWGNDDMTLSKTFHKNRSW